MEGVDLLVAGKRFQDRVVVVTGASSGIGRVTAADLAREGAHVVVTARNEQALLSTVAEIAAIPHTHPAMAVAADMSVESDVVRMVAAVTDIYGHVDAAFLNAGIFTTVGKITEMSLADFQLPFRVNVDGVFLCLKHLLPKLQSRAEVTGRCTSVVVTSSALASRTFGTFANSASSAASKSALSRLLEYAQLEVGKYVRINAVSPGVIETPMVAGSDHSYDALHVAERVGSMDEISRAARHLLSDEASFTFGIDYIVNGGLHLRG